MPTGTLMTMVLPAAPVRSLPMPWWPRSALEMLLVAVVDQRVEVVGRLDDDVAAAPAVAAVGAAELDELLAPEADAAGAAVAALQVDLGLVEEFHGWGPNAKGGSEPRP